MQAVLEEFVIRKNFLRFPDNPEEVDVKIPKYLPLLRALWSKQKNLSFKKTDMLKAFSGVAEGLQLEVDRAKWAELQADILAKWCRRLAQGLLKAPGKWREMLKPPTLQAPYDEWSAEAAEERVPPSCHVVYDREMHTAYRSERGCKVFCKNLLAPEVPLFGKVPLLNTKIRCQKLLVWRV